jgi:hypothetical protein
MGGDLHLFPSQPYIPCPHRNHSPLTIRKACPNSPILPSSPGQFPLRDRKLSLLLASVPPAGAPPYRVHQLSAPGSGILAKSISATLRGRPRPYAHISYHAPNQQVLFLDSSKVRYSTLLNPRLVDADGILP